MNQIIQNIYFLKSTRYCNHDVTKTFITSRKNRCNECVQHTSNVHAMLCIVASTNAWMYNYVNKLHSCTQTTLIIMSEDELFSTHTHTHMCTWHVERPMRAIAKLFSRGPLQPGRSFSTLFTLCRHFKFHDPHPIVLILDTHFATIKTTAVPTRSHFDGCQCFIQFAALVAIMYGRFNNGNQFRVIQSTRKIHFCGQFHLCDIKITQLYIVVN